MYKTATYPRCLKLLTSAIILWLMPLCINAQDTEIEGSLITNASSGLFAPYFIGSLNHGKVTQKNSALADVSIIRDIDPESDSKWSFGFGFEALGGYGSSNDYMRWNANANISRGNPAIPNDNPNGDWTYTAQAPPSAWLQQLYGEVKYRSIYVSAGLKEHTPALMNPLLSSGDFIESGNARPIPELRGGFYDFVDIPLTNGWVQIQTQLAYGKMTDDKYNKDHYNYYFYHIGTGEYYTYKHCHFRSNPDQRLMVTAGMQAASLFGGTTEFYNKGKLVNTVTYKSNLKAFTDMLIPVLSNREDFAPGSTIGTWDFYAQYLLNNEDEIALYFQKPFEDGSGIAWRNKADGIWGLEYRAAYEGAITGVVIEYIDLRDQSGPLHYAPGDHHGTTITQGVSGCDNYYNNAYYNSYCAYGMSIGTPFMKSPIYNLDGYPAFESNRTNGFHFGIMGMLRYDMPYRLLLSHQRGLGNYNVPYEKVRTNTSIMVEWQYLASDNLRLKLQVGYDKGELRGDNIGALLSLSYRYTMTKNRGRW